MEDLALQGRARVCTCHHSTVPRLGIQQAGGKFSSWSYFFIWRLTHPVLCQAARNCRMKNGPSSWSVNWT